MTTTTDELNDQCFARPQWQQIAEMGDTLTESLTEQMHEALSDYMLDMAQDLVSGNRISDATLTRINNYLGRTVRAWMDSHETEIFDHFLEQQ